MTTLPVRKHSHWRGWVVVAAAVISFASGAMVAARFMRPIQARADAGRSYELMIYHAVPGKGAALESVFRDASRIMAKHGIAVVGYWVPNEDPVWSDTFVYVIAHPSREEADKNWKSLHDDPTFQPYVEAAKPLIQKPSDGYRVDEVYMRATDFSALR